jgi:hypothetical protein
MIIIIMGEAAEKSVPIIPIRTTIRFSAHFFSLKIFTNEQHGHGTYDTKLHGYPI